MVLKKTKIGKPATPEETHTEEIQGDTVLKMLRNWIVKGLERKEPAKDKEKEFQISLPK